MLKREDNKSDRTEIQLKKFFFLPPMLTYMCHHRMHGENVGCFFYVVVASLLSCLRCVYSAGVKLLLVACYVV